MKAVNPALTVPSTPRTRAVKASGSPRLQRVTAAVQSDSETIHSSMEPSWLPQTAVMR